MRSTVGPGDPTGDAQLPSAEVRGFIGLALFIHLFAVAVALTSYTYPSPLQERLRQVFGPYIGTLNFDLQPNVYPSGRFYLTHGLESDVDFIIEVLPHGADEPVQVPAAGLWPGERRRRYQALANAAGAMTSGEEPEPVLLRSIAGAILRQAGSDRGTVRALAHKLLPIEAVSSTDPAARDPFAAAYYSTVYEAYVLVSSTGQVDLVKKSAAGEVAPVEKGPE